MKHTMTGGRACGWMATAVLALCAVSGCTLGKQSVGEYFTYRANDLLDILELGFTYSDDAQIALYGAGISGVFGVLGYADFDGYYIGMGGGQLGITRHYVHDWGLAVWGHEKVGWGTFDPNDPSTLNEQDVGVLGALFGPYGLAGHFGAWGGPGFHPGYMPACIHYIHLGWVGVVANLRYLEPLDFVLGIFCIDLFDDDGPQPGRWPWQQRAAERRPSAAQGVEPGAGEG